MLLSEEDETKEEEPQTEVAGSSSEVVTDLCGFPLFHMKGSSKVDWEHVRLVAKKGADMTKVKSQDAIKAFCLLCQVNITYSKGNGNSVYRHNKQKHKTKIDALKINQEKQEKNPKCSH
jgi:hypothetical protein